LGDGRIEGRRRGGDGMREEGRRGKEIGLEERRGERRR